MSRILVTHPGKFGDLMWALPTMRALAQQAGASVALLVAGYLEPIVSLLREGCPYLDWVEADPRWTVEFSAPVSPREPSLSVLGEALTAAGAELVVNLGYDGWPQQALPLDYPRRARVHDGARWLQVVADSVDFKTPWIDGFLGPNPAAAPRIYFGWTDEWFELKVGLRYLLGPRREFEDASFHQFCAPGSRWAEEDACLVGNWLDTAHTLASSTLYVGDLSAQWVLANALGIPCVVVEPSVPRHNPVFWWAGPIEADGRPRNVMVCGVDERPTFDARAVAAAVQTQLTRYRELKG